MTGRLLQEQLSWRIALALHCEYGRLALLLIHACRPWQATACDAAKAVLPFLAVQCCFSEAWEQTQ